MNVPFWILTALVVAPARGETLTKAEVARRGKAATAIVQLHPSAVAGAAFGVHSSGYFVTADALLAGRPADAEITLVLDPGLKTQKAHKAVLVRRDRDLGLALLRVDGVNDLPRLPLGPTDKLSELTELVTLGFPGGARVSPEKPEYPAVVVDVGTVSSVARKDGEPSAIDLKGGPTPVAPGGPVLDDNAAVVGVLLTSGRNVLRAAPVNRLVQFLSAPDLRLVAGPLTRTNRHQPVEFLARVVSVIPPATPLSLELVLQADDEPGRRHTMEYKDGVYRVSTTPIPAGARRLELSAQFETGAVEGVVEDREIQIGAHKVLLSAVKRVRLQPRATVLLADGKTLEGVPAGLDKVAFAVGGQTLTINLSRATTLQVQVLKETAAVECLLIARQDGKEVARFETRLPVQGVALVEPADPGKVAIQTPQLAAGAVVKVLPDIASDIRVGGGGRYLVLHLPKLKKLAVFDVNEAAITRYLPMTEDKIVYAVGLEKVVVGLIARGALERWDLHTGEKELTRPVPGGADLDRVLMGSASRGPVLVNDVFVDLDTMKALPIRASDGVPPPWSPASADGRVFGSWKPNQSPAESTSFVLQGDELKRYNEGGTGHVVPGPDGRLVYTAAGPRTNQLQTVRGVLARPAYCLPAVEGDYFLSLTPAERGKGGRLAVHLPGHEQALVRDVGFDHGVHFDGWDRNFFGPWKRIFFIPRAKLFVILPESNDRLELHRFDVEEALEKSGLDYLLVTSRPAVHAKRGAEYTYQMVVKSKKGDVKYQLNSGPEGLAVSLTGLVTWRVPTDARPTDGDVILTVRDASGQEVFHTFTLRITDG